MTEKNTEIPEQPKKRTRVLVILNKPTIISLPYKDLDGKKDPKIKALKNRFYDFVPGRNDIDSRIWDAVVEQAGKARMDYYYTILRVFKEQAITQDAPEDGKVVVNSTDHGVQDLISLIENTMESGDLEDLMTSELASQSPRKPIIDAIKEKQEVLATFLKQLKSGK